MYGHALVLVRVGEKGLGYGIRMHCRVPDTVEGATGVESCLWFQVWINKNPWF